MYFSQMLVTTLKIPTVPEAPKKTTIKIESLWVDGERPNAGTYVLNPNIKKSTIAKIIDSINRGNSTARTIGEDLIRLTNNVRLHLYAMEYLGLLQRMPVCMEKNLTWRKKMKRGTPPIMWELTKEGKEWKA